MKQYYHGRTEKEPYFEGWYMKYQTRDGRALALIPALHIDASGQRSAPLQVITGGQSWRLEYADADFGACEERLCIQVGSNQFTERDARISIEQSDCSLHGTLRLGQFTPIKSDIMGPFRFFAEMECSHGVISMGHSLDGRLNLNGETIDFAGGTGYIETDRGHSFPDAYLWTQCLWQEDRPVSLMLSVATIPLAGIRFTGCICAIICNDREYRLATYRGARAVKWSRSGAEIRQGRYRLEIEIPEENGQPLRAPVAGSMRRTILENLSAKVRYRFWAGKELLFEHTDLCASFECSESRTQDCRISTLRR